MIDKVHQGLSYGVEVFLLVKTSRRCSGSPWQVRIMEEEAEAGVRR